MSIFVEAAIITEAFLFKPTADSIEEFKPTGSELSACLSKFLRLSDAKVKLATILALHIHYQSYRLSSVNDEELVQYRSLVAKLVSDFGLREYSILYNKSSPGNSVVVPTELTGYVDPYPLRETILSVLHR